MITHFIPLCQPVTNSSKKSKQDHMAGKPDSPTVLLLCISDSEKWSSILPYSKANCFHALWNEIYLKNHLSYFMLLWLFMSLWEYFISVSLMFLKFLKPETFYTENGLKCLWWFCSSQLIVNLAILLYYSIFCAIQTTWGEKWKYKFEKHPWSKISTYSALTRTAS